MNPLVLSIVLLLSMFIARAGESPAVFVVELPRPNSGAFSFAQAEARKLEILSNAPSAEMKGWKNPYKGFGVHVHRGETLTVYRHWTGEPDRQATRTVAEIKQLVTEIPFYGNPAGILITSDSPLRESKVFPELLKMFFKPSVQLFYVQKGEQDGAANGSQPTHLGTNVTPSAAALDPIPPIADADPSIRHSVSVQVPTSLLIRRTHDELAVGFAPLRSTNLTVGSKMVTGTEWEMHIYRHGAPVQLQRQLVSSLGSGLRFDERWGTTFTTKQDGLPQDGAEYIVEVRLTMFETDLPAQHFWSPRSGKRYNVLFNQTFKETVR